MSSITCSDVINPIVNIFSFNQNQVPFGRCYQGTLFENVFEAWTLVVHIHVSSHTKIQENMYNLKIYKKKFSLF